MGEHWNWDGFDLDEHLRFAWPRRAVPPDSVIYGF